MSDSDYICVYRQFFESFAKSSEMEDHRPMRLNLYNLSMDELIGEVMQSCVNFLTERHCPKCLVVPLTKIVVEELLTEAKKQPEEVNTPLKLNRKTLDKISEVCLRYTDNEKLSGLPSPVQETLFSTHSTKHIRRRMEDRHICLTRFNTLHGIRSNSEAEYYGIFDGHAGVNAASFAVSHLHQFLAESKFYPDNPVKAFLEAYEKTESRFNSKDEDSGTTALAILHQPMEKKLIVSWVGDSQALLVTDDSYVRLVDPHKPERSDERRRIEEMGGCIIRAQNVYRVNGGLAISRAIGDKKLKPYVSADPEIRVVDLTGSEDFIVMGCDGLWDVVEPEQVIETVYFEVKHHDGQIDTVARRLVDLAKENDSTDNITVIVLFLTDPSEIKNRSNVSTGHRPKILLENGLIMESNFQPSENLLFSSNSSGLNGIYESNGNHFGNEMRNEFDEDLGPETDVDALDDVLATSKNLNALANDCWQGKTPQGAHVENPDKLIEFGREGGEHPCRSDEDDDDDDDDDDVDEIKEYPTDLTETVRDSFGFETGVEVTNYHADGEKMLDEMSETDLIKSKSNKDESGEIPAGEKISESDWNDQGKDEEEIQTIKLSDSGDKTHSEGSAIINNHSEFGTNLPKSNGPEEDERKCAGEQMNFRMDEAVDFAKSNAGFDSVQAPEMDVNIESDSLEPKFSGSSDFEMNVGNETNPFGNFTTATTEADFEMNRNDEMKEERETIQRGESDFEKERRMAMMNDGEDDSIEIGDEKRKPLESGEIGQMDFIRETVPTPDSQQPVESVPSPAFEKVDPETEILQESHETMNANETTIDSAERVSECEPESKSEFELKQDEQKTSPEQEVPSFEMGGNSPETEFVAKKHDVTNEFSTPEVDFSKTEVEKKKGEEEEERGGATQLLEPSAPALDGEAKDDVVTAESGGEVEDSEDDEWNYFKVESEVRVPVDSSQPCELVLSPDEVKIEEAKMNSALNPDAAEFIPVSSPPLQAGEEEFVMQTPVKSAIPPGLEDIVSASPNWSNMDNQNVPDESAFLKDIKSRPSNIFEDVEFSHNKEDLNEFRQEQNEIVNTSAEIVESPRETIEPELHGISLAKDMTSSFIDPSTMHSPDEEVSKEDKMKDDSPPPLEIVEPVMEEKKVQPSYEVPPQVEEVPNLEPEASSELKELMTSAPPKEPEFQVLSPSSETTKLIESEASLSAKSEPSTVPLGLEIQPPVQSEVSDLPDTAVPIPPLDLSKDSYSDELNKTIDYSVAENDDLKKLAAAVGAGTAVAAASVAAAGVAAVKKDDKKASPKTAASKTTKTAATKPALNGTKTSAPPKRTSAPLHPIKTTAKTAHATSSTSPTKTATSGLSSATRTTPKPAASAAGSTLNRVPARPKPATPSAASRTPISRTTTTTGSSKPSSAGPKPLAKSTETSSTIAASKPKPRVSTTPKRPTASVNGDVKTTIKRTETTTATKKPAANTTTTTTRVSLSARSTAAPARPLATSKTTTTTTRTATPKPRTVTSNSSVTTTSTTTSSNRISSSGTRKTTLGSDKQAKEMANRLTSRTTTTVTKTNGVIHGKTNSTHTTTLTKSKKPAAATKSPSKTAKTDNSKTDQKTKADEKIVEKSFETTMESLNENHSSSATMIMMENNKNNINLINPIPSD